MCIVNMQRYKKRMKLQNKKSRIKQPTLQLIIPPMRQHPSKRTKRCLPFVWLYTLQTSQFLSHSCHSLTAGISPKWFNIRRHRNSRLTYWSNTFKYTLICSANRRIPKCVPRPFMQLYESCIKVRSYISCV